MRELLFITLGCFALVACERRPTFENFETPIAATVKDPQSGEVRPFQALLKVYINNTDGTVNFVLNDPLPPWALDCDECKNALFAEAKRVTEAAYPHLAPIQSK